MSPTEHQTAESYLKSGGTSVNHFYENLLLLKDRMNTTTGRIIAEKRHQFMEEYLRQFLEEWEPVWPSHTTSLHNPPKGE